jgi:hypothetical protein
MTKLKRLYKKIENIINNREKCFLITKTWQVKAKDVKEAMLKHENFEHLSISIKEKK